MQKKNVLCEATQAAKPEKEKGLYKVEQLIIVTVKSKQLPPQLNSYSASFYDNALIFWICSTLLLTLSAARAVHQAGLSNISCFVLNRTRGLFKFHRNDRNACSAQNRRRFYSVRAAISRIFTLLAKPWARTPGTGIFIKMQVKSTEL